MYLTRAYTISAARRSHRYRSIILCELELRQEARARARRGGQRPAQRCRPSRGQRPRPALLAIRRPRPTMLRRRACAGQPLQLVRDHAHETEPMASTWVGMVPPIWWNQLNLHPRIYSLLGWTQNPQDSLTKQQIRTRDIPLKPANQTHGQSSQVISYYQT